MLRIILVLAGLMALMALGCVFEPEPKTRVISCGTIDLDDGWEDEPRDTAIVKGDSCSM